MTEYRKFIRFFALLLCAAIAPGAGSVSQIRSLPYVETFDGTLPPALPGGWESSRLRLSGTDDFALSASSPASAPHCLYAVNATMSQWIASPVFDLTGVEGGIIRWSIRRSATFNASLVLEGSMDGGLTYPRVLGDTLRSVETGVYRSVERAIPGAWTGETRVRFRWRVIPDALGSAGTLRMDDVAFVPEAGWGTDGRVRLDEIMYAPAPGEPEWVEIVNADTQTVNLREWSLSDAAIASRHPLAAADLFLGPGERIVLTRDSVALAEVRFTPEWRVISVSGFPSLNNTGDAVVIFRKNGTVSDSVSYRPAWGGASGGLSLERWDPWQPSADSTNWGTCRDAKGATPGKLNSLARRDRDVALMAGDAVPAAEGGMLLRALLVNRGRQDALDVRVSFFRGERRGSAPVPSGLIATGYAGGSIAPLDSLPLRVSWNQPPSGDQSVVAIAGAAGEERRDNDTIAFVVRVPATTGSVLVNEILFAPFPGEPEYVEVVNAGNRSANIGGWILLDRAGAGKSGGGSLLPADAYLLPPGSFAVIAGDSGIFRFFPNLPRTGLLIIPGGGLISLNDDGDEVVLRDPSGTTIDSVAYMPSWHSPAVIDATGRSLERRLTGGSSHDPWNWSTCTRVEGGTPGRENSIAVTRGGTSGILTCAPNPFSPDGDGEDDAAVIHFCLPPGHWALSMDIYDSRGRMIRRLACATPAEVEGDLVWDGRDDQLRRARVGPYAVVMDARDLVLGTSLHGRTILVLAGRL